MPFLAGFVYYFVQTVAYVIVIFGAVKLGIFLRKRGEQK